MKEKYIERRFGRYFTIPGSEYHSDSGDNVIDMCDSNGDVAIYLLLDNADRLMKDRDEILDMLSAVSRKLDEVDPEAFGKIWYGE